MEYMESLVVLFIAMFMRYLRTVLASTNNRNCLRRKMLKVSNFAVNLYFCIAQVYTHNRKLKYKMSEFFSTLAFRLCEFLTLFFEGSG